MFKQIYNEILKYDKIVIARHIGVDPDALTSQLALRDAIRLSFPYKKVYAVGTGSAKFMRIGKLDKFEDVADALLIVLDTPDQKRVDSVLVSQFSYSIKIDHHPFVEKYCDLEFIVDTACSTCEIVMRLLLETDLCCNQEIAGLLFMGLVSDSNRFLFNSCTADTFALVSYYMRTYQLDISQLYQKLYLRSVNELRLEGYISLHMVVTENALGYVKITNDDILRFGVDSASAGNMVNHFNFIEDILVWATITEDVKNKQIRVSIRSRGPEINQIAEKYNGGGHKYASGVRLKSFDEAMQLMNDLDLALASYLALSNKEDS